MKKTYPVLIIFFILFSCKTTKTIQKDKEVTEVKKELNVDSLSKSLDRKYKVYYESLYTKKANELKRESETGIVFKDTPLDSTKPCPEVKNTVEISASGNIKATGNIGSVNYKLSELRKKTDSIITNIKDSMSRIIDNEVSLKLTALEQLKNTKTSSEVVIKKGASTLFWIISFVLILVAFLGGLYLGVKNRNHFLT